MGKIVKKTKYMNFELVKEKPKTKEYRITNKKTDDELGIINWYSSWRQYVFEPTWDRQNVVFNHTCLTEIAEFLKKLNIRHKEKKNQGV